MTRTQKPSAPQANAWLFVHAPQLLLDFQLASQTPEQQALPQAIFAADSQRILQCNQAADQLGISRQMTVVTATTLCPDLQLRVYQEAQERHVLKQVAQDLYQDVAQIALHPPQGLLLEVRSLQRLYGSFAAVCQQVQQRLQLWRIQSYCASGFSPLSAQLLAQAEQQCLSTEREVVTRALHQLPLGQLDFPAATRAQLEGVGIQRVADLLALPAASLTQRFGKSMSLYLAKLRGQLHTPQHYYRPPPYFYQRIDLLSEVANWTRLLFPLKRMLQGLERFLYSRQLSTRQLRIEAHHRDADNTVLTVRFAQDVWQHADMLSLCQLVMERQPLNAPALELSVRVDQLRSLTSTATDMLAPPPSHWSFPELISRLRVRLGRSAIYSLTATNEQRPEYAQTRQAPTATGVTTKSGASAYSAKARPLWLLSDPEPIQSQDFQVHWGPERLSSGWWDGRAQQRDYFIAVDRHARQAWIFQSDQGWFLHGWFG